MISEILHRTLRLPLDPLHNQISLHRGHIADDFPLEVFLADLLGILLAAAHVGHRHPRVLPDLLQSRSLLVVVRHHFEDEVFELLRVAVLALDQLVVAFVLNQIFVLAERAGELEQVEHEVAKEEQRAAEGAAAVADGLADVLHERSFLLEQLVDLLLGGLVRTVRRLSDRAPAVPVVFVAPAEDKFVQRVID